MLSYFNVYNVDWHHNNFLDEKLCLEQIEMYLKFRETVKIT